MIELIIISFAAGILTVLAPCILPLLPVIIGGSGLRDDKERNISLKHPTIIVGSLVLSIVVFTLLLKATTAFLGVPAMVWSILSGGIVLLFGINLLFPILWEKVMIATGFQAGANRLLGRSQKNAGIRKDILLGAALGPVFNSCSPTYALIVAVILPASFTIGLTYLFAYAVGLGSVLLLIGFFGRVITTRLRWLSNPNGVFQKIIGIIFILVGLMILFGVDKHIQTYVLEHGWYDPIMKLEESFSAK